MLEPLFLALGLVNNVLLIVIFVLRANPSRMEAVRRVGIAYLLLAILAALVIYVGVREGEAVRHTIFLSIFLAFLTLEGLYDFVLEIPFRSNFRRNWRLLVPYLALYYAMNYGFVVMPWRESLVWGIVMLVLSAVQIVANTATHPPFRGREAQ
jgi:hypothetical protein